jgi:hypothetical protein
VTVIDRLWLVLFNGRAKTVRSCESLYPIGNPVR